MIEDVKISECGKILDINFHKSFDEYEDIKIDMVDLGDIHVRYFRYENPIKSDSK